MPRKEGDSIMQEARQTVEARQAVLREAYEPFDVDYEEQSAHQDLADLANDRYVMFENNIGGSTPPMWLSSWDTPEQAMVHNLTQEYAGDWELLGVVDLDTGDVYWPGKVTVEAVKSGHTVFDEG